MKILLGIGTWVNSILHIDTELRSMGNIVSVIHTDEYKYTCSYFQKKLDNIGFHAQHRNYKTQTKEKFYNHLESFHPDIILFVGSPRHVMSEYQVKKLKEKTTVIGWFVDSVQNDESIGEYCHSFHHIFVFEKQDLTFFLENYSISAKYCPVGFSAAYGKPHETGKDLDLVFVGSPFKNRLALLDVLASAAEKNEWKMQICGPFYDEQYFWKKPFFRRKHPALYRFVHNGLVSSEEAASLYARAKICLNIHAKEHKSLNPRTFEIMAIGSLQLLDQREDYDLVIPGQDVLVFSDANDLVHQVTDILTHYERYAPIATSGQQKALTHYSLRQSLERILQV